MLNAEELTRRYWKYYLMLEKRFMETLEYVELDEDNFGVFSNGYALLLQVIGAEVDTFFKEFCGFKDKEDQKKDTTINDYARHILGDKPDYDKLPIVNQVIVLREYNINIQPFKTWKVDYPGQSLKWWNAFTDVKHHRYVKNKLNEDANLENVLNILGALYMLEMMYLKEITKSEPIDIFDEPSKLFMLANWSTRTTRIGDGQYLVGFSEYRPASPKTIAKLKEQGFFGKGN